MEAIKFGTDGVRGKAGEWPINPEGAFLIGLGVGAYLNTRTAKARVLIGRDPRQSGAELSDALIRGLRLQTLDVLDVGVMTTPGIAHLTMRSGASIGVVISASHNPWNENGIKLVGADGFKLEDAAEAEVESIINNLISPAGQPPRARTPQSGFTLLVKNGIENYVEHLVSPFPAGALKGLRVVLDCSNGAASQIAPLAFERLGAEVITTHASPDGKNINHQCGSEYFRSGKGRLAADVAAARAHIAAAFDGDADRVIFCDEQGALVDGDHILYLLARHLQSLGKLPGSTVVTTTMANSGLDDGLAERNIRTLRTPVGDKYVLREMLAGGYVLGGEQSGHIILYDPQHTTGDGIYTALWIASLVNQHPQRSLVALAQGFHKKPQVIASARVASRPDLKTLPEFNHLYAQAQAQLGSGATINVRYSGTEPLVRVMIEASLDHTVHELAELALSLCRQVQRESNSSLAAVEIKDCVSGRMIAL